MRLLIDLYENQGDGFVALKDIAARQDISKKYLEQIVPALTGDGILKTSRGFQGGYRLAKDPSEWKNESRDFYQKEAETRTLLPSYTTYDWKQLQRMTHVEVFDYDVLGNGEKARTVLLFDYQKRDPLTGNAEMIDCSELFYA